MIPSDAQLFPQPIPGSASANRVNAQTGTAYTVDNTDDGGLVTIDSAVAFALSLPDASTLSAGFEVDVENAGAGLVTITPTTSTIDGAATKALGTNQGVRIFSDGVNYFTQRGVTTDQSIATSDVTTNNVSSAKHGFTPKSPADATKFLNGAATPAYAQVKDSDLSTSDITTNDVSSAKHGLAPKSPADATKFLNGAAAPGYAQVKDSDLSTSDIVTNNVGITKHGFAPKSPNDATKFLDGTGAYSVPTAVSGGGVSSTRNINTTSPLHGGGDLSADRTLTVDDATTGAKGVVELANDLAGTATAPIVAGLKGKPMSAAGSAAGQVLIYDASLGRWVPAVLTPGANVTITNADGAITVNSTAGGGGSAHLGFNLDEYLKSLTVDSRDDEFAGTAMDVKWSDYNNTGTRNVTFYPDQSAVRIMNSTVGFGGFSQPLPAGSWEIVVKAQGILPNADTWFGLCIVPAAAGAVEAAAVGQASGSNAGRWESWSNDTTFNIVRWSVSGLGQVARYIRARWDSGSSKLAFYFSVDGVVWQSGGVAITLGFVPGRFVIGVRKEAGSVGQPAQGVPATGSPDVKFDYLKFSTVLFNF